MAWLGTNASERADQITYNFRIQHGIVKKLLDGGFSATDLYNPDYPASTEVMRRIRQNVITYAWPGLTREFAQTKLDELRGNPEYKNPTAKWNGAGGYDVTATRVRIDPAGWSRWFSIDDAEEIWDFE